MTMIVDTECEEGKEVPGGVEGVHGGGVLREGLRGGGQDGINPATSDTQLGHSCKLVSKLGTKKTGKG